MVTGGLFRKIHQVWRAGCKTLTGRLWTYVRDDRPFAGPAPPAALFHFSPDQFQRLMAELGVTCSMSRSGNVWDNAAMVKLPHFRGRFVGSDQSFMSISLAPYSMGER
jgi:transposase InsO family protein